MKNICRSETNMHANNSVAILGFQDGSSGQIETWFEKVTGYQIACFVHEAAMPHEVDVAAENRQRISQRMSFPTKTSFKGYPLITSLTWWDELRHLGINKVLPLTPDNDLRYKQIQRCLSLGIELVSAIHPSALILADAEIASGVWINAGVIIGYKAEVETGALINTGCIVEHHNVLKSCAQLAPGVVTAGNVTFWERCNVYTRAVIINRKQIGVGAIVGAGAVVIDDIPDYATAVGIPAKVIKYKNAIKN